MIVSIFKNNGHVTYLFDAETEKLKLIEKQRYFSVSWFDSLRYVCINDKGLFLRETEGQTNKKLDEWILPQWCQNIDLSFTKYELQVGFVETKNEAAQMVEKLHQSHIPARSKFFKDKKRAGYRIRGGGFKTKQEAQLLGKKIKQKGYDCWLTNIDNLFDFYNSEKLTERKSFNGKTARIEYQKEEFLRSRIVLINKEGTQKIIVDEMNNIQDRSHFKNLNH